MNLSTTYMGLSLKNPLVPSASPLSQELASIKQLEDAGASAIVMYSVFEEQFQHEAKALEHYLSHGAESFAEALNYFPVQSDYKRGPEEYLSHIQKVKESVSIPVIPSINCISTSGWVEYAKKIEQAKADALELNLYFIPTDANLSSEKIENLYLEVLSQVKKAVKIPVALKLSPYFTNTFRMIQNLDKAGANGLVLFNRFYQPDLNLEELSVEPKVSLSNSTELRLPLRWIAISYGKIKASLAGTSGVHTSEDALKLLMAGADIVNLCSVLLKNGPMHLKKILADMTKWLEQKEYESIAQLKGSLSQKSVAEPAAFERANYMKALTSYTFNIE